MQSHEWRPARQCLHTWLSTYVGTRASQAHCPLWDLVTLEQWSATLATPSMRAAHMGLAGATRHGDGVHRTSVVGVATGVVGIRHSPGLPHQGLRGTRRHDGMGVARTSTAPTSGAAGNPPNSFRLRPAEGGRMRCRTKCKTHYTQRALRHTALPACIFLCARPSQPLPFGNSAFGTPHHTTPHHTAPHHTMPSCHAMPCYANTMARHATPHHTPYTTHHTPPPPPPPPHAYHTTRPRCAPAQHTAPGGIWYKQILVWQNSVW